MFKWGVESELVAAETYQRLAAVAGLRRGRSAARDSDGVGPVPDAHVVAVLPHVARPVAAMIQLQRVTGMRPGEVVQMRCGDLDTSGRVWVYTPQPHKTEYHGEERKIYLGPKAQEVIRPFLGHDLQAYLFRPIDAVADHRRERHAARTTPMSCGNRPGRRKRRRPRRQAREHYDTASYRRAIHRGCDAAFPPPLARRKLDAATGWRWETETEWKARLGPSRWQELVRWRREHRWHPNQLRHNAATYLRKEFGIEAARVVLGHSSAAVTEIYAELDRMKAADIMAQVG